MDIDVLKENTLVPAIGKLKSYTDITLLVLCLLYFKFQEIAHHLTLN
jgi:hypothetical protein